MLLASIPSPPFDSLGPLNLYGLSIALGVIAAVWLFGRRLEQYRVGTADDASSIAIWAVLAGVVGARLYHVVTDWERFEDDLGNIPRLWEGGLGIPGGLLAGIPVGLWMAHRHGITIGAAATCAAPAIPLAQAIGRWGNYFNQELYGRPTDLPWALEIDEEHLLEGFEVGTTFHPTFLYESLWSLGVVAVLLLVERRFRPGPGALMGLYLALYGAGRFWVEGLRIDPADEIAGLRWNQWVALAAVLGGAAIYLALRSRPWPDPQEPDGIDDRIDGIDGSDGIDRVDDRIDDGIDGSDGIDRIDGSDGIDGSDDRIEEPTAGQRDGAADGLDADSLPVDPDRGPHG